MKQKTIEKMRGSLEALCVCIPSPTAAVLPGVGVLAANAAYRRRFGAPDAEENRFPVAAECVAEAFRSCRPATGTIALPHPGGDLSLIARCIPVVERSGSAACTFVVFDDADLRRDDDDPGAACRTSARELDEHLRLLAAGQRMPIGQIEPDDPLGDVKRSYNAAIEAVEQMLTVAGLFGHR